MTTAERGGTGASPVHVNEAQVHVDEPQVHVNEAQVHVDEPQVHLSQTQVHMDGAQVHLSQTQVHVDEPQVHLSQTQVRMDEAQVHVSQTQAEQDAVRVTAALYAAHYRSLVGFAVLLLRDVATAEEVVQDSFEAMHANWRRLRDSGKALAYLRQCVLNRSRSVLRHRTIVDRHQVQPLPDMPSAEQGAMAQLERSEVVAALHGLSARQREALVLRYYAEFSEAQIASAMGISRGAVKSHTARAISALRDVLEHLV